MSKIITHSVNVEFGDCDPAAIVWFPNFFRWIDAASRHFFVACGVPPWQETARTLGVIGTPLVATKSRFIKTASYGDVLDIAVTITEWRNASFVQTYRITRANASGEPDLIMECEEVRIFAAKRGGAGNDAGDPPGADGKPGIRAVPAPLAIRSLCE